ncbi:glycine betaine ABC transporter substrate-binding protein [Gordonia aquimaris]|uniref:Glycine/betaine ABC transporter substrate-binding protein n=1 Tax=Gordonia aquimaris TaxID=2984863 RepID=A0A9X3D7B9_9ACTN|nr:glycine betaine ABC transporter substrate-binding protein [Gordonia aquimaris]MCX2965002.1 glycine/betaine ABC transporter substrate-binding protein [Gordonia aquimaris]
MKRALTAVLTVCALAATLLACSEDTSPGREVTLGAPDSSAMIVMAQVYAGALRHAGSPVSTEIHTGDYRQLLDEMDTLDVDLFPAFSGNLLSRLAPQLEPRTAEEVYTDLNRSLPQGVSVGDATMVTATPQVFVAASTADDGQVSDLADCGRLPADLPVVMIGAPQQGVVAAFAAAGCRFGPVESVDSVSAAADRIASGQAVGVLTPLDVAGDDAEGSVGDIRALRVSVPDATASATASAAPSATAVVDVGPRPEELVPVYRSAALTLDEVKTMNVVAGEMTTADLATLARAVDTGADPAELAGEWLAEHGL